MRCGSSPGLADGLGVVRVPASVDAINTFRVAAGRFAYFRVVSRTEIRHFRWSARFLWRVRFPAAPPKLQRLFSDLTCAHQHHINTAVDDRGLTLALNFATAAAKRRTPAATGRPRTKDTT